MEKMSNILARFTNVFTKVKSAKLLYNFIEKKSLSFVENVGFVALI